MMIISRRNRMSRRVSSNTQGAEKHLRKHARLKGKKVAGNKTIWKNRRVLVTGGGGFIGSHLVERLVEMGAIVRAMVHYNALGTHGWLDHSAHRSDMEIFAGDICDRDSICSAMKDVQTVFHLAALIAIPYSFED